MSGIQWKECFSRTRNRKYWFNSATGESTWTAPETETTGMPEVLDDDVMELDDLHESIKETLRAELNQQRKNAAPSANVLESASHITRPKAIPRRNAKLRGGPIVFEYLVLDTNVLLGQLAALKIAFATYRAKTNPNCAMVVPLSVLHELDQQKGGNQRNTNEWRTGLAGYARQASHYLKDALMSGDGSVVGDNIPATEDDIHIGESHDDKIIQCALRFQRKLNETDKSTNKAKTKGVVLLTEDVNMSVIAMSMGMPALTLADFTKKHIEGAERSTGNTQSTTTRRNTRTNNENAGEKSTAINSTSKNRTAFPTDTPPPHVLSRIDSAHKRTRGGGSELSTDSDTYGVDTGPSARATKRKRLQATGSVAKDGEKVQETDTQSAWLRVSNIPKYCTLEQLKYCFRKADVSKPMFVSADRTNEGVGRVLIGPRFGGVSAALERYDGQELLGQTINVRLETQAETAEYSTDPKVTRASTRVRKTSTQTAQPTNNKLKTINQERKNTPSKARGRANIQDKDKIESRRGRANIQDKDKIESRTTKPSITTEANTPTRVEGKWGGATEQAAAKALIKAIWELIPLALKYIFILEYGVDLWQEVVYGKHMLQWTEKTTMRILSRQRQCLNEYWPKAVIDECIPKLIHVKESRVRTIPDENVIQLIRNVTLLCQYVTTRLPEDRAREIGKMRDQILRDVGKLREMAAESRTETALTSPKKGTRCVGGGASVVVSAGTDSMGRSTVRTQERRKDGDTDKTSTGGVDGNDMYRNGGVDGNDMYRNGGVDGIDMNSNGGVYGDEETRAMAPEHTHTGARTGYGEDRDSPSRTTDYGSARADGGLFAGASTGEVGGDRKRSRGVGASMLVSNLQEFRTRTRAGGLGPVDPAQLSPEYYLGGAKETQAALAPFIRDQLHLEFLSMNAEGHVCPQTFLFLEQYSARLSAVSQALQECLSACEHTQPNMLPEPVSVFAALAYALEDYLQAYSQFLPRPNPIPITAMASGYQTYFGQACSTPEGSARAYEYVQYFTTETLALQQMGSMLHTTS